MTTYRPAQVAELLGVSPDTIRRWCDEGRLKTTKPTGGHRQIDGVDLARHLREQERAYEPDSVLGQSARNRLTGIVTCGSATTWSRWSRSTPAPTASSR